LINIPIIRKIIYTRSKKREKVEEKREIGWIKGKVIG
jgi:hypothetical protein